MARAHVNAKFPHTIATKFMVAKIALLNPIDSLHYLHFGNWIAQSFQPVKIQILLFRVDLVADFKHKVFSFIDELKSTGVASLATRNCISATVQEATF